MLKILTYFKQLINKASSNRKLYVYLFCLILAVFFWLLNALGNNYTTTINFKVNYLNFPTNRVVLNDLPQEINIKIKGLGFDLMAYKLQLKKPNINVNLITLKNYSHNNRKINTQTLSTQTFQHHIASQLGEHIEIQNIFPDSIYFMLDEKIQKILPVIPKTNISFGKQFQLFGSIIVKPAVVKVEGPRSVLDTLTKIYTEPVILEGLSESTNKTVLFNSVYEKQHLVFSPSKLLLYIPVEKYTETSRVVKINPINVPDSIELKAIPNEMVVKFMIPLSKIASLESAVFIANVDYLQINESFSRKLKVRLIKYPNFIQSVTLNPGKVEYILKKKNE